eukprot:RCo027996
MDKDLLKSVFTIDGLDYRPVQVSRQSNLDRLEFNSTYAKLFGIREQVAPGVDLHAVVDLLVRFHRDVRRSLGWVRLRVKVMHRKAKCVGAFILRCHQYRVRLLEDLLEMWKQHEASRRKLLQQKLYVQAKRDPHKVHPVEGTLHSYVDQFVPDQWKAQAVREFYRQKMCEWSKVMKAWVSGYQSCLESTKLERQRWVASLKIGNYNGLADCDAALKTLLCERYILLMKRPRFRIRVDCSSTLRKLSEICSQLMAESCTLTATGSYPAPEQCDGPLACRPQSPLRPQSPSRLRSNRNFDICEVSLEEPGSPISRSGGSLVVSSTRARKQEEEPASPISRSGGSLVVSPTHARKHSPFAKAASGAPMTSSSSHLGASTSGSFERPRSAVSPERTEHSAGGLTVSSPQSRKLSSCRKPVAGVSTSGCGASEKLSPTGSEIFDPPCGGVAGSPASNPGVSSPHGRKLSCRKTFDTPLTISVSPESLEPSSSGIFERPCTALAGSPDLSGSSASNLSVSSPQRRKLSSLRKPANGPSPSASVDNFSPSGSGIFEPPLRTPLVGSPVRIIANSSSGNLAASISLSSKPTSVLRASTGVPVLISSPTGNVASETSFVTSPVSRPTPESGASTPGAQDSNANAFRKPAGLPLSPVSSLPSPSQRSSVISSQVAVGVGVEGNSAGKTDAPAAVPSTPYSSSVNNPASSASKEGVAVTCSPSSRPFSPPKRIQGRHQPLRPMPHAPVPNSGSVPMGFLPPGAKGAEVESGDDADPPSDRSLGCKTASCPAQMFLQGLAGIAMLGKAEVGSQDRRPRQLLDSILTTSSKRGCPAGQVGGSPPPAPGSAHSMSFHQGSSFSSGGSSGSSRSLQGGTHPRAPLSSSKESLVLPSSSLPKPWSRGLPGR